MHLVPDASGGLEEVVEPEQRIAEAGEDDAGVELAAVVPLEGRVALARVRLVGVHHGRDLQHNEAVQLHAHSLAGSFSAASTERKPGELFGQL